MISAAIPGHDTNFHLKQLQDQTLLAAIFYVALCACNSQWQCFLPLSLVAHDRKERLLVKSPVGTKQIHPYSKFGLSVYLSSLMFFIFAMSFHSRHSRKDRSTVRNLLYTCECNDTEAASGRENLARGGNNGLWSTTQGGEGRCARTEL